MDPPSLGPAPQAPPAGRGLCLELNLELHIYLYCPPTLITNQDSGIGVTTRKERVKNPRRGEPLSPRPTRSPLPHAHRDFTVISLWSPSNNQQPCGAKNSSQFVSLIFGKFYWLNAQRQTLKARTSPSIESIESCTKFQAQLIQSYPETERVARLIRQIRVV